MTFAMKVKGFAMKVKGFAMKVKGFAMKVKGFAMKVKGFAMKVKGFAKAGLSLLLQRLLRRCVQCLTLQGHYKDVGVWERERTSLQRCVCVGEREKVCVCLYV